jgi:H+/Cl- antiporter ClcA
LDYFTSANWILIQLYISAGLILAIVLWGIAAPNSLGGVFDMLQLVITHNFGWLYLWVVLGLVVLAMVLAFSRVKPLARPKGPTEPVRTVSPRAAQSSVCSARALNSVPHF